MDKLVTVASTTDRTEHTPCLEEAKAAGGAAAAVTSPKDALSILRGQPDYNSLTAVLKYLARGVSGEEAVGFNVAIPSPLAAQIVQTLVSDIAPNYWPLLKEESIDGDDLQSRSRIRGTAGLQAMLPCLRSLPGISAVLLRLRALAQEAKPEKQDARRPDLAENARTTLELLCSLLDGQESARRIWTSSAATADSQARRTPLVQEFLTIFGSGRIIAWAAEAEELLKMVGGETKADSFWVTSSAAYSNWVGQSICDWVSCGGPADDAKLCSELLARTLRLGHADSVLKLLAEGLLLGKDPDPDRFCLLYSGLPKNEQRRVLLATLKYFSEAYLDKLAACDRAEDGEVISAVAGAINTVVGKEQDRLGYLVTWLTSSSGAGLGEGVGVRRAVLAVVSQHKDSLVGVLEKSVAQFGDTLYIRHSPVLQQEAHAQVLLLSAGYVHRSAPLKLAMILRSGPWLNCVSNRLSAPQQRARVLGMIVGEAVSGLVHKGDKKLDFEMEETKLEEGKWYKSLVETSDGIGQIRNLTPKSGGGSQPKPAELNGHKPKRSPVSRQPQQGFIIEEIEDETADGGDDLVPYAKPDSDPEDSDDDPTLVRRDKPRAPVYVRDLIRYLRDTDNYDHQKLALIAAPALIRRKANYGTEVKEHADELAALLVGLQDKFDMENFYQLRVQAMIALIVAQPQTMGRWFARTFFDGDYSVSQRASVLVVLGMSAREMAGFETSEYVEASSFPSKALPEAVGRLYLGDIPVSGGQIPSASSLKPLPPNALDHVTRSLTTAFLGPIAANAADAVSGPDALKLSTFKSRLGGQQSEGSSGKIKVKGAPRARVRVIPNTTAQLLYEAIFSPLTARFQAALRSPASRARGIIFEPYLLSLYLKTLAVVMHAAGPSTLALPQMTAELWALLLNTTIRSHCVGDLSVTHAVLFALLATLDVNQDRMRDVCQELGKEVVETQEWVSSVFEGTRGGDGGDENDVKMFAAAVLIRLREGIEKYRLLLIGDLIGY